MKKGCFILIIAMFLIFNIQYVNAKENNYTNSKNVQIDYELYEDLCSIYSKNYMEYIDQRRFDEIKNNDLLDVEIAEYIDKPTMTPFTTSFETTYKVIRLIKNGNTITLDLRWKLMPLTRSYDVIGIRLNGVNLNGNVYFEQYLTKNGKLEISNTKYMQTFSNGFGLSFKLDSGDVTAMEQFIEFRYTGSGTIFGTYQHAQKNISLADSKKYTISAAGLGNVLLFDSSVSSKYDSMPGVYLTT